MMNIYLLFFCLVISKVFVAQAEDKTLNIMGLLPMTGNVWPGGGACLTSAELALRHVNARADILKDYKLDLTWRDSKCHAGSAVNMMYEMLYSEPTKHVILGPGCSVELEPTAQASPAWNITHVTYGGASPLLSDRERYPRLFRLVAPDSRYNLARIALAKYFNWRKIATLNVALDYFSAVTDDLVHAVKDTEISIITEEIFDHDPLTRLQNLKRKDARIILTASYEIHAKQILCAAYKVGLYGPKIVWIFPGWFSPEWWKDASAVACTDEELSLVAEGSILTGYFPENMKIERGIANLTAPEYKAMFIQEESYRPEMQKFIDIVPNCYDAIWVVGMALNCTDSVLKDVGYPKSLEDFEYSDRDIGDIITSCVYNVSFLGVSGQVKFERTGDPMKNIKIEQIQGGKRVLVGVYWTDVEDWYLEWLNGGLVWKDGVPPRDSTVVTTVEVLIPQTLYIAMSCFAAFGILLAVSFFIFNIKYREDPYVKLSSPTINNVLLLGCMITYASVFLESLQQRNPVLCQLRTCTLTLGFSMAFGALFSKTWRVYRIFSNKKLLRLRIRDSQLIITVLALLGLLSIVLIVWEVVDPLFTIAKHLETYLIDNDSEVHPYVLVCSSTHFMFFSLTIYIIEGALVSFGVFLAFETRRVKIEALNDSQLIGLCLYNVVVLSAVSVTLTWVLDDNVALLYGITSGILIVGTTTTQLIVFIPKIMAVFYPHQVDIQKAGPSFDSTRGGTRSTGSSARQTALLDKADLHDKIIQTSAIK